MNTKRIEFKPGNMLYPVPAVMVSCQRPGEKANIITLAWAGTICSDPPMLSVSIRPERYSYDIIKETGEFVVNLTTKRLVRETDYCGVKSGRDIDKFKECKLTPCESRAVACPGIEESPVNLECKVKDIVKLGSHDMFVAEIVAVNVSEEYMDEKGKFHLNDTELVAYSHGSISRLGRSSVRSGILSKRNSNRAEGNCQ